MGARMKKLRAQEQERLAGGEARSAALETRADQASAQFDAAAYAREAATAQFESFREKLGENVESLRGNQVGRGRIDTGFGMENEDLLVRNMGRDLNRQVSANAFEAARLNLSNIQGTQNAAATARESDLSMLTGSMDREQARLNEKAAKKRGRWGMLAGLAGAGVGAVVGGPAGAQLGAQLGSTVGSNF